MVTTIQVKETTKQMLDNLKIKVKGSSYDQIIQSLLSNGVQVKDMFGSTKKRPLKFSKRDELNFNKL
ncbi:MAG: hypothetical protein WC595_02360 [Candidatus Nanoarchaeia archaeon]